MPYGASACALRTWSARLSLPCWPGECGYTFIAAIRGLYLADAFFDGSTRRMHRHMRPAWLLVSVTVTWESVMPTRERARQKAAKRQATLQPPKRRRVRFEAEPWYAEAARKMSAAKKRTEQQAVPVSLAD